MDYLKTSKKFHEFMKSIDIKTELYDETHDMVIVDIQQDIFGDNPKYAFFAEDVYGFACEEILKINMENPQTYIEIMVRLNFLNESTELKWYHDKEGSVGCHMNIFDDSERTPKHYLEMYKMFLTNLKTGLEALNESL